MHTPPVRTPTFAAVDAGIARLTAAHDEALTLALSPEARAHQPRWLETECDRWLRKPAKIAAATQLGDLHLAVHWEQYFTLRAFPRALFPTLATVLAFLRLSNTDPRELAAPVDSYAWSQLFGRVTSPAASLAAQRSLWAQFTREHTPAEIDGALYADLSSLMQNTACHWSGHWTFDGLVLDRYDGDRIDFAHYFSHHFHTGDAYDRFTLFSQEHAASDMTRAKTWTLFTPSGEPTLRLCAIFSMDGNTDAFLLEAPDEFIELRASGS